MIQYFFYSSLCSGLLLLVYKLLLEKEKMHLFNRFYLLLAVVFSYTVPCIIVRETLVPGVASKQLSQVENIITASAAATNAPGWQLIALCIFCLVTIGFFARLVYNLYQFTSKITTSNKQPYQNAVLVLTEEEQEPYSFLQYIFIKKSAFENGGVEKEILYHELAHARQRHSYDILFIELARCFFWWNPLLYFYKKSIQLNHEFLADEAVIHSFDNVYSYQSLLLDKISGQKTVSMASLFHFGATKKRLIMMRKSTSWKISAIKQFAVLPVVLVCLFMFGKHVVLPKKITDQLTPAQLANSISIPTTGNEKSTGKATTVTVRKSLSVRPLTIANTNTQHLSQLSPLNNKLGNLKGSLGQLSPMTGRLKTQP